MTMKRGKWLVVIGGVILSAAILFVAVVDRPSYRSPVVMELGRTYGLRAGLGVYARDHDGRFPRTLSEIDSTFYPPYTRQFHDPVTKEASEWIYYEGYTLADDSSPSPAGNIIVASPSVVGGHLRIVVYSDTAAALIEENKFVLQLSKQLNERRR